MQELFNQILGDIKSRPEYLETGGDDQKYYELVDLVLEEWQNDGKIDEDCDASEMKAKLRSEWRDIEHDSRVT
ncbi:hypothetical protein HQ544_03245 [Candidatus Falkowbacteria bacterium]|nr:hypothetical protein [Candidatus Falkowbacteria bacterium]